MLISPAGTNCESASSADTVDQAACWVRYYRLGSLIRYCLFGEDTVDQAVSLVRYCRRNSLYAIDEAVW